MKKIGIILIALLIMSAGFITGCIQRPQQVEENGEKQNEFVDWSEEKFNETASQIEHSYEIYKKGNWSNTLYHFSIIQDTIDNYTKQANDFTLEEGVLDSARDDFITWLNALKVVYDKWESAVKNFIDGNIIAGNSQFDEAQILMKDTKIYVDNYKRYISEWRNEG
jgi:hypothetical protein